ncbi:MAG: UDP-N-acetylmuramate dehydrogenase [Deltaproteobacteria bacterium]|uniref:UDP-N-acetylenolpyruvoylglucosamine reductase n=1 Tax=Candidatus Zymogenus saltonus TaxID=2844893 RepID=A0A9D8KFZ9_9DELT|nr:UDP-N-acetylmuramate dehydrogenase [Candidatus Zymogenus saltonus]
MDIEKTVRGEVRRGERMEFHTTYGIGGPVDLFIVPADTDDLAAAVKYLAGAGIPVFPLGMGSNVLVSDSGFRGAVVCLRGMKNIKEAGENKIFAEAGVPLSQLVEKAASKALSGLEFASGIPGSVGGAVVMNAGAYGAEMEGVILEVTFVEKGGSVKTVSRKDMDFRYRRLVMGEGEIVSSALFLLKPDKEEAVRRRMGENNEKRREKHPLGAKSAGSVFKNPKGPGSEPAGKIIEGLGLKGKRIGDAEVSPLHGNFIVNLGKASARDVLELINIIRKRAMEERGIDLQLEVKVLGEDR